MDNIPQSQQQRLISSSINRRHQKLKKYLTGIENLADDIWTEHHVRTNQISRQLQDIYSQNYQSNFVRGLHPFISHNKTNTQNQEKDLFQLQRKQRLLHDFFAVSKPEQEPIQLYEAIFNKNTPSMNNENNKLKKRPQSGTQRVRALSFTKKANKLQSFKDQKKILNELVIKGEQMQNIPQSPQIKKQLRQINPKNLSLSVYNTSNVQNQSDSFQALYLIQTIISNLPSSGKSKSFEKTEISTPDRKDKSDQDQKFENSINKIYKTEKFEKFEKKKLKVKQLLQGQVKHLLEGQVNTVQVQHVPLASQQRIKQYSKTMICSNYITEHYKKFNHEQQEYGPWDQDE